MKELSLLVQNPTGFHARPAKMLAGAAKKFLADITLWNGEKKANAKSMISVLKLGVERGTTVRLEINGEDEAAAARVLADLIASGFGDAESAAEPTPHPAGETTPRAQPMSVSSRDSASSRLIQGIPAAAGIGIGPVRRLQRAEVVVEETFAGAAHERARLRDAIDLCAESSRHCVTR